MNQVAQRNIPEEWTPEMWQAHVCEMEKRMNEMERDVQKLKEDSSTRLSQMDKVLTVVSNHIPRNDVTAPQEGVAWLR